MIKASNWTKLFTGLTVSASLLLAFDAPVIASGSARNGTFFAQWAAIVDERGVTNAWAAGNVDLEAAWAVEPDLIVISTTVSDSALAQRAGLEQVAPVIVGDFVAEPVLANLPSVQAGQVYGLGANSFRIDYYSSLEIIEDLTVKFGN